MFTYSYVYIHSQYSLTWVVRAFYRATHLHSAVPVHAVESYVSVCP